MDFVLPKRISDKARRDAKKLFPKESFMLLIGKLSDGKITVFDYWYPKDTDQHSTDCSLQLVNEWFEEARIYAESVGGVIVASIHSHPYTYEEFEVNSARCSDTAPSESDWNSFLSQYIMGICVVCQNSEGKLSTKLGLYGPIVQLNIKSL